MPDPLPHAERTSNYYRGVADAMDVVREHEFPFSDVVDLIAEHLAPEHDVAPPRQRLCSEEDS